MMSERAIRMIATFITKMFSSIGLKPRPLPILSPTVEKKCWMSNGSPPFVVIRDLFLFRLRDWELLNEFGYWV